MISSYASDMIEKLRVKNEIRKIFKKSLVPEKHFNKKCCIMSNCVYEPTSETDNRYFGYVKGHIKNCKIIKDITKTLATSEHLKFVEIARQIYKHYYDRNKHNHGDNCDENNNNKKRKIKNGKNIDSDSDKEDD